MKPSRDLYEALGTARGASQDDIRKAHRRLVREHHPDANPDDPGAEERFKEIQHAYEVLSDPEERRQYDERLGAFSGGSPGRARPGTRARPAEEAAASADLSNLLRRLAGLSSARRGRGGREAASPRARGEQLAHLARSIGLNITLLSKGLGESLKTGSAVDPKSGGSRERPSGAGDPPRQKRVKLKGRRGKEKKVKGPKARRRRRSG